MEYKKLVNKKLIFLSIIILVLTGYVFYNLFFKNIKANNEKVYILKEFYSNKKLKGMDEYVIRNGDTILHGKFINYNEKGNKIAEGYFVNGNIFGNCIYYYDNGLIEEIHFRKNKDITLESIWNYPNGKIEKYAMYPDFGKPIFIIEYDKTGVVDSYGGNPQLEIYQHKVNIKNHDYEQIKKSFKIGDKLKYSYIVANIPNAKRSFNIENIGVNSTKVKRTLKKIEPCQIDVEEVLTKKGKNTIRSIVRYEFNDKVTPVFTDTLSFDIKVY